MIFGTSDRTKKISIHLIFIWFSLQDPRKIMKGSHGKKFPFSRNPFGKNCTVTLHLNAFPCCLQIWCRKWYFIWDFWVIFVSNLGALMISSVAFGRRTRRTLWIVEEKKEFSVIEILCQWRMMMMIFFLEWLFVRKTGWGKNCLFSCIWLLNFVFWLDLHKFIHVFELIKFGRKPQILLVYISSKQKKSLLVKDMKKSDGFSCLFPRKENITVHFRKRMMFPHAK